MTLYGRPTTKFVYRNNLTQRTGYGVKGDSTREGNSSLRTYCPGYVFEKNVIAGVESADYPQGNFHPSSLEQVGFLDFPNHNYRLAPASRYRKAGTDGKDVGCDFDGIIPALQAKSGTPF